jgi:hypothetical protein
LSNNGTCSSQEQATNEKRQKDWIAARCVEYLRQRIASDNPGLVELAAKTDSRDVRAGVVYKIYRTISDVYPGLAKAANEAHIRKTRQLEDIHQETELESEPRAPITKEQLPAPWKDTAEVAAVRAQATQVANAMLIVLKEVHEYLVPAAAEAGVVLDSQAAHAWAMSAWICLSNGSKAHWKMPTERAAQN